MAQPMMMSFAQLFEGMMGKSHEEVMQDAPDFGNERPENNDWNEMKMIWEAASDLCNLLDNLNHMSVDVSLPFAAAHFNVDINAPGLNQIVKLGLNSTLLPKIVQGLSYME